MILLCFFGFQGHGAEWALTKKHESEDFFGVQVKFTKKITQKFKIDFLLGLWM